MNDLTASRDCRDSIISWWYFWEPTPSHPSHLHHSLQNKLESARPDPEEVEVLLTTSRILTYKYIWPWWYEDWVPLLSELRLQILSGPVYSHKLKWEHWQAYPLPGAPKHKDNWWQYWQIYCSAHLQFLLSFIKPLGISRVYHVYQNVGVVEVVPPVGSYLSLTPDVPNIELETLTLDRLDVKT